MPSDTNDKARRVEFNKPFWQRKPLQTVCAGIFIVIVILQIIVNASVYSEDRDVAMYKASKASNAMLDEDVDEDDVKFSRSDAIHTHVDKDGHVVARVENVQHYDYEQYSADHACMNAVGKEFASADRVKIARKSKSKAHKSCSRLCDEMAKCTGFSQSMNEDNPVRCTLFKSKISETIFDVNYHENSCWIRTETTQNAVDDPNKESNDNDNLQGLMNAINNGLGQDGSQGGVKIIRIKMSGQPELNPQEPKGPLDAFFGNMGFGGLGGGASGGNGGFMQEPSYGPDRGLETPEDAPSFLDLVASSLKIFTGAMIISNLLFPPPMQEESDEDGELSEEERLHRVADKVHKMQRHKRKEREEEELDVLDEIEEKKQELEAENAPPGVVASLMGIFGKQINKLNDEAIADWRAEHQNAAKEDDEHKAKLAKEKEEKAAKEKAERVAQAKEKVDKKINEKAEKLAHEMVEKEKAVHEEAEKLAHEMVEKKEKTEKDNAGKAADVNKEKAVHEEAEKLAHEMVEKEKAEKAKIEKEKDEKEMVKKMAHEVIEKEAKEMAEKIAKENQKRWQKEMAKEMADGRKRSYET